MTNDKWNLSMQIIHWFWMQCPKLLRHKILLLRIRAVTIWDGFGSWWKWRLIKDVRLVERIGLRAKSDILPINKWSIAYTRLCLIAHSINDQYAPHFSGFYLYKFQNFHWNYSIVGNFSKWCFKALVQYSIVIGSQFFFLYLFFFHVKPSPITPRNISCLA